MTTAGYPVLFWPVVLASISAVGSYFACRKPLSRFFFFLLAPVMFLLLSIPVMITAGVLIPHGGLAVVVGSLITFGMYAFTCYTLYQDGPGGVALVGGSGGNAGRKGGGGDDGTTPPPPITYRRLSLK